MCKLYTTSYTCTHTSPIELFPCGFQTAPFACICGIEIIFLSAPKFPRGKGKCRNCRRKDAERWRDGKPPLEIKIEEKKKGDGSEEDKETTIKVEKDDMKVRLEEMKSEAIRDVRARALEIRKKVEREENLTPKLGKWFGW
ncbi:hypothetical protein BDZ45DRAFT_732267 [Acephala macrosclerotiorum]|nr:hypothetical protein BDZ45DRAFT_732267 [Acephala macrosclerotiorum]